MRLVILNNQGHRTITACFFLLILAFGRPMSIAEASSILKRSLAENKTDIDELKHIGNLAAKLRVSLFSSAPVLSDPAYFKEVVLNSEFGDSVSRIRKWKTDINYVVLGNPGAELAAELERVVAELNALISIELMEVAEVRKANFKIFFGTGEDYVNKVEPNAKALIATNFGLAWNYWNRDLEIGKGSMYVDTIRTDNNAQRKHLLREELTQSLGILTDSLKYPDSIFYQKFSHTTEFTDIDREVIRMLYHPDVIVGMDEDALDAVLALD